MLMEVMVLPTLGQSISVYATNHPLSIVSHVTTTTIAQTILDYFVVVHVSIGCIYSALVGNWKQSMVKES